MEHTTGTDRAQLADFGAQGFKVWMSEGWFSSAQKGTPLAPHRLLNNSVRLSVAGFIVAAGVVIVEHLVAASGPAAQSALIPDFDPGRLERIAP